MSAKIYGVILAGGSGRRMGSAGRPKQFLNIGEKPIIVHTIEKFVFHGDFEKILVLTPGEWMAHTEDLIRKYVPEGLRGRICVLEGGSTRNETVMNSIDYIERETGMDDETIIVTHDSVRPFVSHRIIEENIRSALEHGACDTVIAATDTIVESLEGSVISSIPDRSLMYQGQTPQSFRAARLKELYLSLSNEEKAVLTDACKIFVMKGEKVHLVMGDSGNIKITYPEDLRMAEALYSGGDEGNAK